MRYILFLLLFLIPLFARDNPFTPVVDSNSFPIADNKPVILEPFKEESITFPDSARALNRVVFEYKNLDGSIEQKVLPVNKSIDWHMPITLTHSQYIPKSATFSKKEATDFIYFEQSRKRLKAITKDQLLRHFMIAKPYRIVLDFSRTSNFLTKVVELNHEPFVRARLGNHKDYYRVVIELDGQYEYSMVEAKNGVSIEIR